MVSKLNTGHDNDTFAVGRTHSMCNFKFRISFKISDDVYPLQSLVPICNIIREGSVFLVTELNKSTCQKYTR